MHGWARRSLFPRQAEGGGSTTVESGDEILDYVAGCFMDALTIGYNREVWWARNVVMNAGGGCSNFLGA